MLSQSLFFIYKNKEVNTKQYNYEDALSAIIHKVHMVLPKRSNLSFAKTYSATSEAGFENLIAEYTDCKRLLKGIKKTSIKKALMLKAMGYLDWEAAQELRVSERTIRNYTAYLKKYFNKNFPKNGYQTTL